MTGDIVEKHQLAGFDERARGFNRIVEVHRIDRAYKAVLKYEAALIAADGDESGQAALHALIRRLHAIGFTQLRSQRSFQGADYLGSREPWIEHPDPPPPRFAGLLARWFGWLRRDRTDP
jgi:hypothetical protein